MKKNSTFLTMSILLVTQAPIAWAADNTNTQKTVWVTIKTTDGQRFSIDAKQLSEVRALQDTKNKHAPINVDISYDDWNKYVQPFLHIASYNPQWDEQAAAIKQFIVENFSSPSELNMLIKIATALKMAMPLAIALEVRGVDFVQRNSYKANVGRPSIINLSTDGATLMAVYPNDTIYVWNTNKQSNEPIFTSQHLALQKSTLLPQVALSPSGNTIAAVSNDHVYLWEIHGDTNPGTFSFPSDALIEGIMYISSELLVIITTQYMALWNTKTNQMFPLLETSQFPEAVAASTDGSLFATLSGNDKTINVIDCTKLVAGDATALTHELTLPEKRDDIDQIKLQFSTDNQRLIALVASAHGTDQYHVYEWDLQRNRALKKYIKTSIQFPLISPNGAFLATQKENTITVWSMATGSEINSIPIRSTVAIDNNHLITTRFNASTSHTAIIAYDLHTGESIETDAKTDIRTLLLSADGSTLCTLSFDGAMQIWSTTAHRTQIKSQNATP
ncbi:MAG: hypothetical protein WCE21_03175 [Candidatus Babeliales bacterium]